MKTMHMYSTGTYNIISRTPDLFISLRGDIIILFFNILKQSEIWWVIILLFDLELHYISTVYQNANEFLLLTSIVIIEVNEVRKYSKVQPL